MSSRGISLSSPGTRHLTLMAVLLSMLGPFSVSTYLPSFPDIEAEFAISRALLSQSLGFYLLAFAFSTLFWGPLADRFGRRPVIMVSMGLYTLGSIGCALANSAETFLLLRVAQGLAVSGGLIASRAIIRDAHDAESAHRAMSQVMLLFAVAPAIAPILGSWLHDHFGWRSVFWFLSAYSCVLVLLACFIHETLAETHRQSIKPIKVMRVYLRAMLHERFLALVFCMSLAFAGLFLYIAGAPTVIYDFLSLGTDDFGWLFVPMVAGFMLGAYLSGRLAHRLPARATVSLGFGVMLVGAVLGQLLVNVASASILTVVGPLVLFGVGISIMLPVLTILALDCLPHNRGTAASMQGFVQMLVSAVVASFAVPLLNSSWPRFASGQLVFLLLALFLWLRLRRAYA